MKPSCKFRFFSTTTTVSYSFHNDHTIPTETKEIPINSPSKDPLVTIIDHPPQPDAAAKIQAAYRAHIIRTLYKKISSVNSEADQLEHKIQRQETVDAIRSDEREKLRINEALMGLLLRLDSVPGIDPTLREARRKVSHRIVGLQEIVDGICGNDGNDWCGGGRFMGDWDEMVAKMEEEICKERGGEEMERFCAEYLGFRCLQRFLHEP
ncbi:BAG family molecular chaperone regulator 5, mitochondrial [Jatropha curcas]|uniref:BAG family molecular chaperone regulator 5, mitochondrial n=1 Tax=Jatropha curcas TaxID=180498 RepID=UPI0005FC0728|nr:BAG family molecular chaperone regulator 5, mitochondrial [Jatropha curcas]XP_012066747.1 BAG family molecular chaperone regulator 5, mitochondrial [Jatropha curcas]XP_012066748.1 BAG family molecular chaperone regulator 5, mitochondrial [Jatropha curcas]XP_020533284.1 BAG family molecular chaperone regulator 5, mitochondrial [Jatropha curcas]XP_020533285.1 BAG family molecular chaperone regulator 5, mitochondrial [Jatropha curcas]XP_020533286.1 BAG family molecular chaperone regulator 5, m